MTKQNASDFRFNVPGTSPTALDCLEDIARVLLFKTPDGRRATSFRLASYIEATGPGLLFGARNVYARETARLALFADPERGDILEASLEPSTSDDALQVSQFARLDGVDNMMLRPLPTTSEIEPKDLKALVECGAGSEFLTRYPHSIRFHSLISSEVFSPAIKIPSTGESAVWLTSLYDPVSKEAFLIVNSISNGATRFTLSAVNINTHLPIVALASITSGIKLWLKIWLGKWPIILGLLVVLSASPPNPLSVAALILGLLLWAISVVFEIIDATAANVSPPKVQQLKSQMQKLQAQIEALKQEVEAANDARDSSNPPTPAEVDELKNKVKNAVSETKKKIGELGEELGPDAADALDKVQDEIDDGLRDVQDSDLGQDLLPQPN